MFPPSSTVVVEDAGAASRELCTEARMEDVTDSAGAASLIVNDQNVKCTAMGWFGCGM